MSREPVLEIAVKGNVQGILILISFFSMLMLRTRVKYIEFGHNSHVMRAFMKTTTVVYWKRML